jgi:hypothetical protein
MPRAFWDAALGLGAAAYLVLALFDGMDSPFLSLLVIVLLGRRLFHFANFGG